MKAALVVVGSALAGACVGFAFGEAFDRLWRQAWT